MPSLERGILYVPDFVANRMGIVQCANEQYGVVPDDPSILRHFGREWENSVYVITRKILASARAEGITTTEAANTLADTLSLEPHPIFPHRGREIVGALVRDRWHERRRSGLAAIASMQLYPTSNAVHVAATGIGMVGLGVVMTEPAVVAWGGAVLVGLAVARAVTLLGVARVRAAGFEMLWCETGRARRALRGETVELSAEVRNRDTRAARYVSLRAVASPDLHVEITPSSGEVPAGGRLGVTVRVRAVRVGRHGLYGLSLEVRGSPGLFEIPLTFANPFGIEVMPATHGVVLRTARGGRSRTLTEAGRPGPFSGDGYELREIREHRAGDPLKRVAWKASARRGKLMVRGYEQEERDVVWLVVDASVELWAGPPGRAPLDHAIDEATAVAIAHLGRGDHVGLVVCGARVLARIAPGRGPAQAAQIASALVSSSSTLDADRSGLDEDDVAARVLEHLKPLDPGAVFGMRRDDRDALSERALRAASRAPVSAMRVHGIDSADKALRGYLSAFGVPSPPRLEPDRPRTDEVLGSILTELSHERPHPSLVYVWSPAPDPVKRPVVTEALRKLGRRRFDLRWVRLQLEDGIVRSGSDLADAVGHAVALRARAGETVGEHALRKMGVSVERVRPRTRARQSLPPDAPNSGEARK